jgi:hypothetical protein
MRELLGQVRSCRHVRSMQRLRRDRLVREAPAQARQPSIDGHRPG